MARRGGRVFPAGIFFAALALAGPAARAQTESIDAAPAGTIEAGAPPFAVLGPEALGLNAAPVDLQPMPDGRLLAFGRGEFAVGDGVRWEVFRQADDDAHENTFSVAIGPAGRIFAGVTGGFGEIRIGADGRWRCQLVEKSPPTLNNPNALTYVTVTPQGWFWSWGSGPIIAWQPGQAPTVVGQINALERIFPLGGEIHMSDQSNGRLFRWDRRNFGPVDLPNEKYVGQTITAAVPWGHGHTLLGTISMGLLTFDGETLRPFVTTGPLGGSHRINDLCDLGHGLMAVALDNVGIVFIDRTGRIVQTLDRNVDNRLSRVKRLLHTPGGLWALLNEGVARVGFPSRVSSFEHMVETGLGFSQIYRHEGRLWLMSDGQAQRGVYNEDDRLTRFEVDTPADANAYLTSLVELDHQWIATTAIGIYRREPAGGWTKLADGPVSPHIRTEAVRPGCWLYAAENEAGWLHREGDRWWFDRLPQPGMGHVYGALTDAQGVLWAELGSTHVARLEPTWPRPTVEVLGPAEGVLEGWAQLFLFEGEVRVNVHDQILRYSPTGHRYNNDLELQARFPGLTAALGRPAADARGRLWITRPENVLVLDPRSPHPGDSVETIPGGLRPFYYEPQADGVMWMHERTRLARFDPTLPLPESVPLRAKITQVELPASGVKLFPRDDHLPDLGAAENTLIVHYASPDQPYGQATTFEVQLEGANSQWIATGAHGSITFNHLDAGGYRLHVRSRLGARTSEDALLSFAILAPWYRTRPAYLIFAFAAVSLLLGAIWLTSYFERREKARLEELVAVRTRELAATNHELERQIEETTAKTSALRASEERFRRLSDNAPDIIFRLRVVPDVAFDYVSPAVTSITGYRPDEFLADPAFPRRIVQPPGAETIYDTAVSRRVPAGVRDVKWITRDGRIITLEERLSPVHDDAGRLVAIEGISRDITEWVEQQEHRQRLESQLLQSQKLESVGTLAGGIAHDFNNILTGILGFCELATLAANGDRQSLDCLREIRSAGLRAKDLVNQILTFSRRAESKLAAVNLAAVVREALKLVRASTPATIDIQTALEDGVVQADSTQIHQIVVNLCTNGIHAMQPHPGTLRINVYRVGAEAGLAREIPDFPGGPCLCLAVSDTGHGMDQATLARIFDPFFTTKRPGEGTGLGLSIVQGIVANHGAALRVHSQPGRGASFEIYFRESVLLPGQAEPPQPPPRGEQKSILVVDDEPTIASFLVATLKRFDYRVTAFSDPREALAAVTAEPQRFDGMVTDLTMPHMTGVELVRRIRALGVLIPVVLTSGYNKELSGLPPEVSHRTFLISKPFDSVELARMLGRALNSAVTAAKK